MYARKRMNAAPFLEYARFAATGVLNTATDFLILNALLLSVHYSVPKPLYVTFKAISFIGATIQSYFVNKYWVFGSRKRMARSASAREKGMFLAVSAAGFAVNSFGALWAFGALSHVSNMSMRLAANLGALAGTAFTQITNFLGYKFLVFKNNHERHPPATEAVPIGSDPGIQRIEEDRSDAPRP